MSLTLIAAMSQNRVIGIEGRLPWRLPADLAHFKKLTVDKSILMGRLTYESIGRPLPRRRNLVLTRSSQFNAHGIEVFHGLDDVLDATGGEGDVMVIGGGQIYALCLPLAHRIELTIVHQELDGDAWFPELDRESWMITRREDHRADERNDMDFSFVRLERASVGTELPPGFPLLPAEFA